MSYFALVSVLVAVFYAVLGCRPGFTGYKCDTRCAPGCRNQACTLQGHGGIACDDGCYDGFSGESCRTECPGQCKRCDRYQSELCLECNSGYFGEFCEHRCQTCGAAGCDREGMCKERPQNCDGGVICGQTCIQKCRMCSHAGTCSECQPEYAGDSCQKLCTNCLGTCNQDGCSGGCKCGYTGDFCQKQCSSNCFGSCDKNINLLKCSKVNGTCLMGCKDGHFGERCQHRCNKNCNICEVKGGECHKCNKGYYGESCENSCINCEKDICAKKTGRCYACKNGYYGTNCDLRCDSLCTYACERYTGVCVAQNTTVDVTKKSHGATGVGQLPVSSSTQNSSSHNLGEAKSKTSEGPHGIVFWSCIAAAIAVATVVVLTCIGVCHQRFKNRRLRRKEGMMLVTRKVSLEDPLPELPSTVNSLTCQNDYEEIPEMSDEVTGLTRFTVDESQAAVREGDVHTAKGNKMPRKVYLRDTTRNYRSKDVHVNKYLSVMDTASTDGYLDIIG